MSADAVVRPRPLPASPYDHAATALGNMIICAEPGCWCQAGDGWPVVLWQDSDGPLTAGRLSSAVQLHRGPRV